MYRMPNDPEKAAEEWTEDWVEEQVRRANPLNDVLFKYTGYLAIRTSDFGHGGPSLLQRFV